MRCATVSNAVLFSIAAAILASCGGGYGGSSYAPPPPRLLIKANLQGSQETTVADPSAKATVMIDLVGDGTLTFAATAQSAWVGSITGLHIHRGDPGANGPIEVDLLGGGATFDPATRTAEGTLHISSALANEILTSPAYFYANVHTTAASAGLARSQLGAFAPVEWHAVLLGSQETTVADASARGAAALRVATDRTLTWAIAMATPAVGTLTDAHVHVGALSVPGAILVNLGTASATVDAAAGTMTRSLTLPMAALARISQDLDSFYVNVHTAAASGGVARGQLDDDHVEMWAPLRGDRETAVVDAAARGGATLELDSFTAGRASLAVPAAPGIGALTGAHVHAGGPLTAAGPTVIDLEGGADYATSASTNTGEGSIAYDQLRYARLLANPGAFYADFHTAGAPNGLMRSQLTQAPQTVFAVLSGTNEVPPGSAGDTGRMNVVLTGIHACSFTIQMTSPPASAVTGAHVHDGAVGVPGPILIDLTGGTSSVSGNSISGNTFFTGRTFARLLADAASAYGNVHTLAAPGGVARGQMALLTEDTPPAGLLYDTPVVYTTQTPIPNNVPSSIGGAVTSYAVAPALPAGIVLNTTSGVVSGTPTAATAAQDYVVTASNSAGGTPFTVNITVNVSAPAGLAYTTPVTYVVGTAIATNSPTSTGGAIASYSVSPALPGGLALNTTTGDITGTPTTSSSATDYVVTGTNTAGTTPATVNIKVDATLQPPNISYTTPVTYDSGYTITANSPTSTGGAVDSYSVSPALPSGITLNTTTGIISGKPTTTSSATDYTVTATNAAGTDPATVKITVNLGAPANLTYSNNPNIGYYYSYSGTGTFAQMDPTIEGGGSLTYTVSPALPAGITINASSGAISGSPTATSTQTTYTVTATNATNNTTKNVTITIL